MNVAEKTNAIVSRIFFYQQEDKTNTTTPMAAGEEVGVAPSRLQSLVPLRTYRPIS